MDIVLKTEYWNDLNARAAFKSFMRTIHGLDFSLWESAGCWDDAYTPFSFFQGDKIVASVCIYLLDSVIDGRETRLAQVSGVGTLPQWRRRGLSRQLTEIGLAWAQDRHDGIFLFADTDAIPYYERTGFSPIEEYVVTARLAPTTRRAFFGPDDGWLETDVIPRALLVERRSGPLIVEEYDATCIIPPGASAVCDDYGNIVIDMS